MRTAAILLLAAGLVYGISAHSPYVSVPILLVFLVLLMRGITREADSQRTERTDGR
jgi:hypothetical protein